ncbi:MAG: AAA family ATPase [Roseiflexaceae bacterium]
MPPIEILLFSSDAALITACEQLEGTSLISVSRAAQALQIINTTPPQAIYLEDSARISMPELWAIVRAGLSARIRIIAGLSGAGLGHTDDLRTAGVIVLRHPDRSAILAELAQRLGIRQRLSNSIPMIAVAAVKGGVGKTLLAAMIAEGLHARGARVLVIDNDISNSGLRPTFRIPSTAPCYTQLSDDQIGMAAWTPEQIAGCIYRHTASGLDFLLGPEELNGAQDLDLQSWYQFFQAVRQIEGYDLLLFDTSPEIMKRPAPYLIARAGGYVVLPAPPGRKERTGVLNLLRALRGDGIDDLTKRTLLVGMEPERGSVVSLQDVLPLFANEAPHTRVIGTLARDPRVVSAADSDESGYRSPLSIAPYSRFSYSIHTIVERLANEIGLRLPYPAPRRSLLHAALARSIPSLSSQRSRV